MIPRHGPKYPFRIFFKLLTAVFLLLNISRAQFEFAPDYMASAYGGYSKPVDMESYGNNEGLHAGGVFLYRYSNYLGVGGKGSFNTFSFHNSADSAGILTRRILNILQLAPAVRLKTPGKKLGTYGFIDFAPSFYQEVLIVDRDLNPTAASSSHLEEDKKWTAYTDLGLHFSGGMLINHLLLQFSIDHVWAEQGQVTWINFSGGLGL